MTPSTLNVEALLEKMEAEIKELILQRELDNPLMIGIRTGGAWIAERLHQRLALPEPLGVMDISFYRDDFTQVGMNPKVKPTHLPCATEARNIILVDDVVMTGRTIRAALNELFDYGRPASVSLVALLDLQRRELPIQSDVVGSVLDLAAGQQVKLTGPEPLSLEISERI